MKDKGILTFKVESSRYKLNYIKIDDSIYMLTLSNSNKIRRLKNNNFIAFISYKLFTTNYEAYKIDIIENKNVVLEILKKFIVEKHSYYQEYEENLIALKIK